MQRFVLLARERNTALQAASDTDPTLLVLRSRVLHTGGALRRRRRCRNRPRRAAAGQVETLVRRLPRGRPRSRRVARRRRGYRDRSRVGRPCSSSRRAGAELGCLRRSRATAVVARYGSATRAVAETARRTDRASISVSLITSSNDDSGFVAQRAELVMVVIAARHAAHVKEAHRLHRHQVVRPVEEQAVHALVVVTGRNVEAGAACPRRRARSRRGTNTSSTCR